MVFVALPLIYAFIVYMSHGGAAGRADVGDGIREHPLRIVFECNLVIAILVAPAALFTRKESRADLVEVYLQKGHASPESADGSIGQMILGLALLGVIYGEFLIIDALKNVRLNVKLRRVDRTRAATILMETLRHTAGLETGGLLKWREDPISLRSTIGFLIAQEWVEVSRDGRRLYARSDAMRALRK